MLCLYNVSLISGDGIGPEISKAVISIIEEINDNEGIKFSVKELEAGDIALKKTGKALPQYVIDSIKNSDVCLKAPVGESAADVIVVLRRILDLYANIRPAKTYPTMPFLKPNIDLVIVRENTEDLYIGKEFEINKNQDDYSAVALRIISKKASERIARYAFSLCEQRNSPKKKSNLRS